MKNLNYKINKLFGTCVPNLPRYYGNKNKMQTSTKNPAFSNALDYKQTKERF